jgi:hypothetical protein
LANHRSIRRVILGIVATCAIAVAATSAAAMHMQVAGDQIILSGPVNPRDDDRLKTLLDEQRGKVTTIILRDSPGGDAAAGYAIGDLIRGRRLRTAVSGYCLSSCSRMFLGGVERQFTDEQPVGKTRVGFHGNYKSDGRLMSEAMPRLRAWIIAHSDGKADPALVERWTNIQNRNGFIYFFDSTRLNRKDGVSVFICTGNESKENRFNECEKLPGRTGYELGIFTSTALVKVNR